MKKAIFLRLFSHIFIKMLDLQLNRNLITRDHSITMSLIKHVIRYPDNSLTGQDCFWNVSGNWITGFRMFIVYPLDTRLPVLEYVVLIITHFKIYTLVLKLVNLNWTKMLQLLSFLSICSGGYKKYC